MSTFRFENPDMAPVSRATWAACQARIAELELQNKGWELSSKVDVSYIADLEAELAARTAERDVLYRQCDELEGFFHYQVARADKAEARLADVIALCDESIETIGFWHQWVHQTTGRAAATGDTT